MKAVVTKLSDWEHNEDRYIDINTIEELCKLIDECGYDVIVTRDYILKEEVAKGCELKIQIYDDYYE